MANPQCEDGFLMAALELAEALFGEPGMTGLRGKVMLEAMMQIYGPAKLRTAKLDAAEIAKRRGVAGSAVRRAIGEVVRFGLLEKVAEDEFRIVKDYEKHTYSENEVARERRLCAARNAVVLAKSYARRTPSPTTPKPPAESPNERDNSVTPDRSYRNRTVTPSVTELLRCRDRTVTPSVTELLRNDPSPYRNAGASEDLREIKKTPEDPHTQSEGVSAGVGDTGQPQGPLAETPANLRGQILPMVRNANGEMVRPKAMHPIDPETRARLVKLTEAIRSSNLDLAYQLVPLIDSGRYPAEWLDLVFTDALGWSPSTPKPLLNKLAAWEAAGGPPKVAATMAVGSGVSPQRKPFNRFAADADQRRADADTILRKLREGRSDVRD